MGRTTYYPSRPAFVVDPQSLVRNSGRQINWDKVPTSYKNSDGKKVIAAGTVLGLTVAGQGVPRAATQTLTSVVVASNVATATLTAHGYAVGDKLTIAGANLAYANGTIVVVSVPTANTFTYAAVGSDATATGTITAAYTAQCILETDAVEDQASDSKSGYGCLVGGMLYENRLADATGTPKVLPSAYKSELQTAGVGTGFGFEQFSDSRAS
jgi:hypothetical protein